MPLHSRVPFRPGPAGAAHLLQKAQSFLGILRTMAANPLKRHMSCSEVSGTKLRAMGLLVHAGQAACLRIAFECLLCEGSLVAAWKAERCLRVLRAMDQEMMGRFYRPGQDAGHLKSCPWAEVNSPQPTIVKLLKLNTYSQLWRQHAKPTNMQSRKAQVLLSRKKGIHKPSIQKLCH